MKKKIAFIRKGKVPIANERVAEYLQKQFPDLELEIIDITQILENKPFFLFLNAIFTLAEYGFDILRGRKTAKESFWRTHYLFCKIKSMMGVRLSGEEYLFSFQMQSLFDASTAALPHFIYTDHTNFANLTYPMFDPHHLYQRHAVRLEKRIYANATQIFTRSHNITRSLVEDYGCNPDKVVCVYAGSNAIIDDSAEVILENDNYTNKNILFVGIDWERKGGPELVAAFERLLQNHPDAKLTIVGSTPDIDLPNCRVVGRVPVEEINGYYQSASIYCMPTKLEPFGIVFIEALAHKLPIVATDIGAIPDFVSEGVNGYLVKPGEVDGLVKALDKLLSSPERCRRFGERGYRIASEKYNWDQVTQRMKNNIEHTIGLGAHL